MAAPSPITQQHLEQPYTLRWFCRRCKSAGNLLVTSADDAWSITSRIRMAHMLGQRGRPNPITGRLCRWNDGLVTVVRTGQMSIYSVLQIEVPQ
jgi:hypothetical protein